MFPQGALGYLYSDFRFSNACDLYLGDAGDGGQPVAHAFGKKAQGLLVAVAVNGHRHYTTFAGYHLHQWFFRFFGKVCDGVHPHLYFICDLLRILSPRYFDGNHADVFSGI